MLTYAAALTPSPCPQCVRKALRSLWMAPSIAIFFGIFNISCTKSSKYDRKEYIDQYALTIITHKMLTRKLKISVQVTTYVSKSTNGI